MKPTPKSPAARPAARPAPKPLPTRAAATAAVPDAEGWFQGFGGTAARRSGNFIQPGGYVLVIECMRRRKSEKPGQKGDQLFICEFSVLHVDVEYEAETDPQTGKVLWGASNKAGERVVMIQNTTKHHVMALGTIKSLLLAVAQNMNPDLLEGQVSEEDWEATIMDATNEPGDHYKGHRVVCTASKSTTKTGGPFTPLTFLPHSGPDVEWVPETVESIEEEYQQDYEDEAGVDRDDN